MRFLIKGTQEGFDRSLRPLITIEISGVDVEADDGTGGPEFNDTPLISIG